MCFDCLLKKDKHIEHCGSCNKCVYDWHLHSKFLNRCVGSGNARSYYVWVHTSSLLLFIYFCSMHTAYLPDTKTPLIYAPMELLATLYTDAIV